jgi:hypothetical protein
MSLSGNLSHRNPYSFRWFYTSPMIPEFTAAAPLGGKVY